MGNLHSSFRDRRKSNVSTKTTATPAAESSTSPSPGFVRRATLRLQKKLNTSSPTTGPHVRKGSKQEESSRRQAKRQKKQQQQQQEQLQKTVITDDTNVYRDGRRHQNINSKYILPNDELEQDRLTNLHFVLKHCFSGNYSAPVQDLLQQPSSSSPTWHNNISAAALSYVGSSNTLSTGSTHSSGLSHNGTIQPRVLDIACGTGIWILEMASEFPHAQFYGIDLSTMYPADIKPPNTHFCQGDVLNGLPYTDAYFDYIHMSLVYNCFSYEDRKQLLLEIRRVLKPGGYVEFRDAEPCIRNAGPKTKEYLKPFRQAMLDHLDIDVTWATHMCENLQHIAGMTDIHHQVVSINFMSSSKLSTTFNTSVFAEWESYRYFCLKYYNLTNEKYDAIMHSVIDECKKQRSFLNYVMCWGRRPIIDVPSSSSTQHGYVRGGSCTPTQASGSSSSSVPVPTSCPQNHHHHFHTPPLPAPSFIKSVSSPGPDTATSTTMSRPSPKSGTQSSSMIPSSKNSPGSLKAREDARRNKEKASDIYQFVHGYVE